MIIFQGILRAATTLAGRTDKKTGEVYPSRDVLQIESVDGRGLVQVETITVPDLKSYQDKVGKTVNVPVRPWAKGATVNYLFETPAQGA
jgi:hypothetical protein